MLDLKELWIGDQVCVINTGKIGIFKGISPNGFALIKLESGTHPFIAEAISLFVEEKKKNIWIDDTPAPPPIKEKTKINDEIDLHLEKLDPELQKALPQLILSEQIKAAKNYLDLAIKNYHASVKIIHGKGTGQLKTEVYHLLKSYPEVYHSIPANDGGAVEVLFRYGV